MLHKTPQLDEAVRIIISVRDSCATTFQTLTGISCRNLPNGSDEAGSERVF